MDLSRYICRLIVTSIFVLSAQGSTAADVVGPFKPNTTFKTKVTHRAYLSPAPPAAIPNLGVGKKVDFKIGKDGSLQMLTKKGVIRMPFRSGSSGGGVYGTFTGGLPPKPYETLATVQKDPFKKGAVFIELDFRFLDAQSWPTTQWYSFHTR